MLPRYNPFAKGNTLDFVETLYSEEQGKARRKVFSHMESFRKR
jgi:hypothetical protein